jgi:hypothetical protein
MLTIDFVHHSAVRPVCEKLFLCDAASPPAAIALPPPVNERLVREARRHVEATISAALERNNTFFREEREKLERWADDAVDGSERDLRDTKEQIKVLTRQARTAPTTEAQHEIQQKIIELERKKRRQRERIFDVEDEILARRDKLIGDLEKRLTQKSSVTSLFTLRWTVR